MMEAGRSNEGVSGTPIPTTPFIITHSGPFHVDELVACVILKGIDAFRDHPIIRSRDRALIAAAAVAVDVGNEYDAGRRRFDHHQRRFRQTMDSLGVLEGRRIPVSSAGLVYAEYGKQYIRNTIVEFITERMVPSAGKTNEDDEMEVERIFAELYDSFIGRVDGVDNKYFKKLLPLFPPCTIWIIIKSLRPHPSENKSTDRRFFLSMDYIKQELNCRIFQIFQGSYPKRPVQVLNRELERLEILESSIAIVDSTANVPADKRMIGVRGGDLATIDASLCLATFLFTVRYERAVIVRTTDELELERCEFVVQDSCPEEIKDKTDLASKTPSIAQRAFHMLGRDVIRAHFSISDDTAKIEWLWSQMRYRYVDNIPSMENDVLTIESECPAFLGICEVVQRVMNSGGEWTSLNDMFAEAITIVGHYFLQELEYLNKFRYPDREYVRHAFQQANNNVLVLERCLIWKDALREIEEESSDENSAGISFAVFPSFDDAEENDSSGWVVQGYRQRCPFPEKWHGLRDAAAQEETGVADCYFVHNRSDLAQVWSRDGAIKVAETALRRARDDHRDEASARSASSSSLEQNTHWTDYVISTEKTKGVLIFGVPECGTERETLRRDDDIVKGLVEDTNDDIFQKALESRKIIHYRRGIKRILTVEFESSPIRDAFLAALPTSGRPPSLRRFDGVSLKKELTPEQVKAHCDARRRNKKETWMRGRERNGRTLELPRPSRDIPPSEDKGRYDNPITGLR